MDYDANRLTLGSNPIGHDLETNTLFGGDAISSTGANVTVSDLVIEMARSKGIRPALPGGRSRMWSRG